MAIIFVEIGEFFFDWSGVIRGSGSFYRFLGGFEAKREKFCKNYPPLRCSSKGCNGVLRPFQNIVLVILSLLYFCVTKPLKVFFKFYIGFSIKMYQVPKVFILEY